MAMKFTVTEIWQGKGIVIEEKDSHYRISYQFALEDIEGLIEVLKEYLEKRRLTLKE